MLANLGSRLAQIELWVPRACVVSDRATVATAVTMAFAQPGWLGNSAQTHQHWTFKKRVTAATIVVSIFVAWVYEWTKSLEQNLCLDQNISYARQAQSPLVLSRFALSPFLFRKHSLDRLQLWLEPQMKQTTSALQARCVTDVENGVR